LCTYVDLGFEYVTEIARARYSMHKERQIAGFIYICVSECLSIEDCQMI
jgi:hypothetical protein